MRIRTILSATLATAVVGVGLLHPAPAAATGSGGELGTNPLSAVLLADGDEFDHNSYDFDIVTQAALAVIEANPDSPVALLTDGTVALTAFLPNDVSFRLLAKELTNKWYRTEQQTFAAIAGAVPIATIENILLYHVIPGVTIDSRTAARSDGAPLTTALTGGTLTVDVISRWFRIIRLVDADTNDEDPFLVPGALDINRGNRQIAHGIFFVLRPVDLP